MKWLIDTFLRGVRPTKKKKPYCVIKCTCGNRLNDGNSHMETVEYGVYEYECYVCNKKSVFNFNIAPCPILMK